MNIQNILEKKTLKIVCFGDSVSEGYFESGNESMHAQKDEGAVYHNRLKAMLETVLDRVKVNVVNSGRGGDSALRALSRMDSDVLSHYPDLLIICFGLNDVNNDIEDYTSPLNEMFSMAKANGIECIFMTPNMLNCYVSPDLKGTQFYEYAFRTADYQNNGRMDLFMQKAVGVAANANVTVCDCYSKWRNLAKSGVDTTKLLANYINHPNRNMHKIFAYSLFENIMGISAK